MQMCAAFEIVIYEYIREIECRSDDAFLYGNLEVSITLLS